MSPPKDRHIDQLLDEALEGSFPASDPIAVSEPEDSQDDEEHVEELLDEALEESFSASDPVSIPETMED